MKAINSLTLFMLCMLPPALGAEKLGAPDNPITFIHSERSLQPGEMILLKAQSSQPLKGLSINVFGRDFPAFAGQGGLQWTGLVGIDVETKPGEYPVKVSGTDKNGKSMRAEGILNVRAKKFPERKLTVQEKYVTPPADVLIRIEQESKRTNSIFASTDPYPTQSSRPREAVKNSSLRAAVKKAPNFYFHAAHSQ